MRTIAIVCYVTAVFGMFVAINHLVDADNRPRDFEDLVGYAVGSFLVPIACLIAGLVMWGKSNAE